MPIPENDNINTESIAGADMVNAVEDAQGALLQRFAPAAVGIDSQFEIFYHNGPTNRYLSHSYGPKTSNLLHLVPEAAEMKIRSAAIKALQENTPVSLRTGFLMNGKPIMASLTISRISPKKELLLVTFRGGSKRPALYTGHHKKQHGLFPEIRRYHFTTELQQYQARPFCD